MISRLKYLGLQGIQIDSENPFGTHPVYIICWEAGLCCELMNGPDLASKVGWGPASDPSERWGIPGGPPLVCIICPGNWKPGCPGVGEGGCGWPLM